MSLAILKYSQDFQLILFQAKNCSEKQGFEKQLSYKYLVCTAQDQQAHAKPTLWMSSRSCFAGIWPTLRFAQVWQHIWWLLIGNFLSSPQNVNGIKYHAKNGHRTQIRVRKPFKCRCGKSYKTAQGLRHHTINFHPPVSAEMIRKMQQ